MYYKLHNPEVKPLETTVKGTHILIPAKGYAVFSSELVEQLQALYAFLEVTVSDEAAYEEHQAQHANRMDERSIAQKLATERQAAAKLEQVAAEAEFEQNKIDRDAQAAAAKTKRLKELEEAELAEIERQNTSTALTTSPGSVPPKLKPSWSSGEKEATQVSS